MVTATDTDGSDECEQQRVLDERGAAVVVSIGKNGAQPGAELEK